MGYMCNKCGSEDIVIVLKKRWEGLARKTYQYLSPEIQPFMNNNSRGETVEIYKEFLLCNCKTCGNVFFEDTLLGKKENELQQ